MSSAVGLDSYEDWVLQCDMIPSYNEYKQQLQILYLSLPDKQLVLKAPEHLWHLDTLFENSLHECFLAKTRSLLLEK